MKEIILSTSILIVFCQASLAMGPRVDYKQVIRDNLSQVDISDGVSKEEAMIIAQNYMLNKRSDIEKDFNIRKPWVTPTSLFPDSWVVYFPTTFSFRNSTGLKWGGMFVNKKTGELKYSGEGPC